MNRILVIGGTLFIGRALVRRLLARGDEVTIMHRRKGTPFGDAVREIQCDRNDVDAVRRALPGRDIDVVFDNVYDFQRGTTADQVAAAALAVADSVRRYVFTSSVAAYGKGLDHDEDDPLAPPDDPNDYARNKAETERALFRLHAERGLPATTFRPPFVYGPENPFYREAFFWDRIVAGRPILVPDDGSRLMQLAHVEDIARAGVLAIDDDVAIGRAYNVGNEPALTQLEFVHALARAAGREAQPVFVPRDRLLAAGGAIFRPPFYFGEYYDVPSITENTARVRRELGLEPIPLQHGLRDTFEWYLRQTDRPPPDFSWEDGVLAAEGVLNSD